MIFCSFKSLNESKCQLKAYIQYPMMPKKYCHSLITLPHTDVISTPTYRHHIWFGMQFLTHTEKPWRHKSTTCFVNCFSMQVCVFTHTIKYILKYKSPWNNCEVEREPQFKALIKLQFIISTPGFKSLLQTAKHRTQKFTSHRITDDKAKTDSKQAVYLPAPRPDLQLHHFSLCL